MKRVLSIGFLVILFVAVVSGFFVEDSLALDAMSELVAAAAGFVGVWRMMDIAFGHKKENKGWAKHRRG